MSMAVEMAVSSPFVGWGNVDIHVGKSGAVAASSDVMVEVELRTTYCGSESLLCYHEPRE